MSGVLCCECEEPAEQPVIVCQKCYNAIGETCQLCCLTECRVMVEMCNECFSYVRYYQECRTGFSHQNPGCDGFIRLIERRSDPDRIERSSVPLCFEAKNRTGGKSPLDVFHPEAGQALPTIPQSGESVLNRSLKMDFSGVIATGRASFRNRSSKMDFQDVVLRSIFGNRSASSDLQSANSAIVKPFSQMLQSLSNVRTSYMTLTNVQPTPSYGINHSSLGNIQTYRGQLLSIVEIKVQRTEKSGSSVQVNMSLKKEMANHLRLLEKESYDGFYRKQENLKTANHKPEDVESEHVRKERRQSGGSRFSHRSFESSDDTKFRDEAEQPEPSTPDKYGESDMRSILDQFSTFKFVGFKATNCIFEADTVRVCYIVEDSTSLDKDQLHQQLASHLKIEKESLRLTKLRRKPVFKKTIRPGDMVYNQSCTVGAFVNIKGNVAHALLPGHGKTRGDTVYCQNEESLGDVVVSLCGTAENYVRNDIALVRLQNQAGYDPTVVSNNGTHLRLNEDPEHTFSDERTSHQNLN